jgi:hypothetical protein
VSVVEQAHAAPEQVRLAEWVFAHEGFLNVITPATAEKDMGGNADVWQMDRLRNDPFTVWRVCFAVSGLPISNEIDLKELVALLKAAGTVTNLNLRGLQVPVKALNHLSSLSNLSNLDLTASPVITREALPYLSSCKQLKLLRVGDSGLPVDHAVVEELRLLLPDCDIHEN